MRRGFIGPGAIPWALLTGLLAGCAPSSVTTPDEPALREEAQALSASEPYLVRDINPRNLGSLPMNEQGVVSFQGMLFFSRSANGRTELWKSDGTETGTVLVKRFAPGEALAEYLTVMDGTLFFFDGLHKTLWKSDGTEAGTVRITPLDANGSGNLPQELYATAVMNGRLYLFAFRALWVSDGTAAGTFPLKSDTISGINRPLAVNGTLFFINDLAGGTGLELWKSDGTAAGTVSLGRISSSSLDLIQMVALNGTLFFSVNGKLWTSDGTPGGTGLFKDGLTSISDLTVTKGRLFFSSGGDLWTSDGTAAGTVLVTHFNSFRLSSMMATNGGVVFSVYESELGETLWSSDGTVAGTVRIQDPCPGNGFGELPVRLASAKGLAFFSIQCTETGRQLWRSDGTAAGTVLLKAGAPKAQLSLPGPDGTLALGVDGTLFFWADDGLHGPELWKSQGTAESTGLVRDIETTGAHSYPSPLVALGDTVFFTADEGTGITGLWKSDGTEAGTVLVHGPSGSRLDPSSLTLVNGTLFFVDGSALWKSDGTGAGTVRVHDFAGSGGSPRFSSMVDFGGKLFFVSTTGDRQELWRTDGTEAGTVRVKELPTAASFSSMTRDPVVLEGSLYFIIGNASNQEELWRTDGTEAGTVRVKNPFQEEASVPGGISSLVAVNGKLFFLTSSNTLKLWRSDGTEAGTTSVPELYERFKAPVALARAGNTLFALSGYGFKLWKSDGTVEGTSLVRELLPNPKPGDWPGVISAKEVRGQLYLLLYAPPRDSPELWRTDGTPEGTVLVQSLDLGSYNQTRESRFTSFAEAGKRLFLVQSRGHGLEPWALPLAPFDCPPFSTEVEATGLDGARVDFPAVRRAADVDASLPLSYSHPSGSQFPLGTTQVTLTASDPAYPASSCTFPVTVRDTTPPTLQCPAPMIVESPDGESVVVEYPPATATDNASIPTVEYSIPSGSTFPVGMTLVQVKVKDSAGLGGSCSFSVDVMPGKQGCGCGSTSPAAALGWLMALVPLALRRRARASR